MADRNLARVAAPLALAAAVVAVLVVVALSGGETDAPSARSTVPEQAVTRTTSTRPARSKPRTYVVESGDTLSAISEKTGATLDEILRLNPDVDPQTLQTGERLKLAP